MWKKEWDYSFVDFTTNGAKNNNVKFFSFEKCQAPDKDLAMLNTCNCSSMPGRRWTIQISISTLSKLGTCRIVQQSLSLVRKNTAIFRTNLSPEPNKTGSQNRL